MSTLVSVMFANVDGSIGGVRNRNGCMFFITVACGFIAAQFVILVFPRERPKFLREINSNTYSEGPYFMGRLVSELPFAFICPIAFGTVCYFIVGFDFRPNYYYKFPLFCKYNR